MKTIDDIYNEIGISCYYCEYAFTLFCKTECINPTLSYMCEIAENMILDGDYFG